jgi:hypothetical protein
MTRNVRKGWTLKTAPIYRPLGWISVCGRCQKRTRPQGTVLYCRVSTADQTLEHQLTQAEAAGFRFDEVVADHGISGVRIALRDRPEGRRLFDVPGQATPS